VTNAALSSNGELRNNRSLCRENRNYPAVAIQPRLDFLLNAPDYAFRPFQVSKEVAP